MEEGDGDVKQETNEDRDLEEEPKGREKASAFELYVYTMEELSHCRKKDLLGNVTILEGLLLVFLAIAFSFVES